MRKTLLASAAILGATGGLAFAQSEHSPMFESQGQMAMPWAGGPAANNNNNAMGIAAPGGVAVPTPGTVVIRLNGRVYSELDLSYGTVLHTAPGTLGAGTSGYKANPVGAGAYFRMYPGVDGLAANGLRYGASVEIRQNFEGGNTFNGTQATTQTATTGSASSASGNSSSETLFVRRAFTYLGSDQAGIVRLGVGDGLISLFDYTGIFTSGSWDGGIGNILNAGVQSVTPNQYLLSWAWESGNGVEYDSTKIVYLTPQFFGFDFGVEYDPNMGNSFSNSATSGPYQIGPCIVESGNCINNAAGTDPTRWLNKVAVGARYMGSFNGLDVKAYGVYVTSGKESVGPAVQKFDGLNLFNGGVALTYAGFTVNGDFTIGRQMGTISLEPTGAPSTKAELAAVSYANGPWSVGAIIGIVDHQGTASLVTPTGFSISQRHEVAFAVGGNYKVAPGMNIALEYQYEQKHQGDFNFCSNAVGTACNDVKVQGLTLATIMSW